MIRLRWAGKLRKYTHHLRRFPFPIRFILLDDAQGIYPQVADTKSMSDQYGIAECLGSLFQPKSFFHWRHCCCGREEAPGRSPLDSLAVSIDLPEFSEREYMKHWCFERDRYKWYVGKERKELIILTQWLKATYWLLTGPSSRSLIDCKFCTSSTRVGNGLEFALHFSCSATQTSIHWEVAQLKGLTWDPHERLHAPEHFG